MGAPSLQEPQQAQAGQMVLMPQPGQVPIMGQMPMGQMPMMPQMQMMTPMGPMGAMMHVQMPPHCGGVQCGGAQPMMCCGARPVFSFCAQVQPQMQPQTPPHAQDGADPHMRTQPFARERDDGDEPFTHARCTRSDTCVQQNGHRGRCSLQARAGGEDLVQIVHQIREMQAKVDAIKADRDRLRNEVTTLHTKLSKTCTFLGMLVRSKRSTRSPTNVTADECQHELERISFDCLQLDASEKREQFFASLAFLESGSDGVNAKPDEERRADIQTYRRQFEHEMVRTRALHKAAAAANAEEMMPFMMAVTSPSLSLTEPCRPAVHRSQPSPRSRGF
ncbi:hypothetical protein KFE25_011821 [Diacronema lutheri]|uniref:Uncharacterized protein n=1 Tax=Diacronema lutheri TaxID=2081491 RepID=A0A8J5XKD4_DIALT|nr:hypothetical protein KFE25_011821 [Diacronema lutheri]